MCGGRERETEREREREREREGGRVAPARVCEVIDLAQCIFNSDAGHGEVGLQSAQLAAARCEDLLALAHVFTCVRGHRPAVMC